MMKMSWQVNIWTNSEFKNMRNSNMFSHCLYRSSSAGRVVVASGKCSEVVESPPHWSEVGVMHKNEAS